MNKKTKMKSLKSKTVVQPSTSSQSSSEPSIYQLKISLENVKPPVWRRIHVLNNITFEELHYYIQIAMGWRFPHLYQFIHCVPEALLQFDQYDEDVDISDNEKISTCLSHKGDKLIYIYDFGDDWKHLIRLEKVLPFTGKEEDYPKFINGKRACPPEDCGGVEGFHHLLEVFQEPEHPEYKELFIDGVFKRYPQWHPEKFNRKIFNTAGRSEIC